MSELQKFLEQTICVVTNDGRVIMGTLKGYDQTLNVILEGCHERVYSVGNGADDVPLGLYIVRGDNIAIIGEVDTDFDSQLDLSSLKAEPLKSLVH